MAKQADIPSILITQPTEIELLSTEIIRGPLDGMNCLTFAAIDLKNNHVMRMSFSKEMAWTIKETLNDYFESIGYYGDEPDTD